MGKWGNVGQRVHTSRDKVNRFRDLMYSMVTIVNNCFVYLKVDKRMILNLLTIKGRGASECYGDTHFSIYKCIKSVYTP